MVLDGTSIKTGPDKKISWQDVMSAYLKTYPLRAPENNCSHAFPNTLEAGEECIPLLAETNDPKPGVPLSATDPKCVSLRM